MSSSVFLNLNTNFSNDTAANFSQFFDNEIDIPANSTVALYNAELKKAPINLNKNEQITIFTDSGSDVSKAFVLHNTDASLLSVGTDNVLDPITATIPKGSYTKRAFLNELQYQFKTVIEARNADTTKPKIPYQFCVHNDNDSIFAGLAPNFTVSDFKPIGTEAEYRHKNMSFVDNSNVTTNSRMFVPIGTDIGLDAENGIKCWAMSQSAINPLIFGKVDNTVNSKAQGNIFFDLVDDDDTEGNKIGVCFLRTSDIETHKTSSDNLATFENFTFPKSFFGIQRQVNAVISPAIVPTYTLTIFANYYNSDVPSTNLEAGTVLFSTQVGDTNDRFGVSFYYENVVNPNDATKNKFYFRVHTVSTQTEYISYKGMGNIIFDSKEVDYEIPQSLISQCFKFEQSGAMIDPYMSGLVPTFYSYNSTSTVTTSDIEFADITGNYIFDQNDDYPRRDVVGIINYSLTDLGSDLQGVLGNKEIIKICPNGWDRVSTPDFGITELYGDTANYNIEISNLPINTNQSTESVNNNIGTKRPIVFQVNNAFSGSVTEVNSGELIRSIYPPQLKHIALNNVKPIKLNSLNVKIKRGKDNSQANELNDAKIELLFNH